jgi:hypothetical protein
MTAVGERHIKRAAANKGLQEKAQKKTHDATPELALIAGSTRPAIARTCPCSGLKRTTANATFNHIILFFTGPETAGHAC